MITDTPRSFPDSSEVDENSVDGNEFADTPTTTEYSAVTGEDRTTISPAMVTVISVDEEEDTTKITVTTAAPEIIDPLIETETDIDYTTQAPVTEEPIEKGEHEFDCEELDEGDLGTTTDQIPMKCTQIDGSKRRRVFLVISKSQVDADTLFAKNVKVVVKDLMVMNISPESDELPKIR